MFVPMVTAPEIELASREVPPESRWFIVDRRANVLVVDGEIPEGSAPPMDSEDIHLLGRQDGIPVLAGLVVEGAEPPMSGQWLHLRKLYGSIPEQDWALAGRAVQIITWDLDHRFCGRCGQETEHHGSDRARVCPSCGSMAYPRLTPAVIVLVERDDGRALLAWGRQFPGRFYSALAGFVEPGESLEECVVREVKEEVGIEIGNLSYFGSQPWPFPHSVMIGFRASYVSGELQPQESEIVEADWYHHDELPPAPRGGMSIAGWLIEDWIARRGGA
ncbi:MAG: NAD(+) diphosphatase [Actinomycetia bacterium]|nr:NAD(+) diphosphatase [Actinomycetes bacterium]MCP4225045.1 NAD(+) diphosphatase [Actinomycetes bacterium]MCP5034319.1 NAD(+) diphosphatase [Actinomycetes bacterium]